MRFQLSLLITSDTCQNINLEEILGIKVIDRHAIDFGYFICGLEVMKENFKFNLAQLAKYL